MAKFSKPLHTQTYSVPFYFILNSDLSVIVADENELLTELIYGVDFSASGGGNADGGSVTLNNKYEQNYRILIFRDPPETQETAYYENGKFPAKSHEKALDKLTMLIQKHEWWFQDQVLKMPNYLSKYFDANGKRIANLADPKDKQDAATKIYVDSNLTQVSEDIKALLDQEEAERKTADNDLQKKLEDEERARALADANIQSQLTGDTPLSASAFSPISWHSQTINNSVNIPEAVNAWSIGPVVTISDGQQVTVGEGSYWTIIEGELDQ